jgi:GT2 family glycosyltransferase
MRNSIELLDLMPQMRYDIIVPHYGSSKLTDLCLRCIESIRENSWNYRLILVDNGSPEFRRLEPEVRRHPHTLIRNTKNLGFVRAVNQGLWSSTAERIVILNNDTEVVAGWLEKLDAALIQDIGLAGPRTTAGSWQGQTPDQGGIVILPETSMLAFFCVMIRRDVLETVGVLDQQFGVGFGDDDDYCYRAQRMGFRLAFVSDLVIPHHHRSTFRTLYVDDEIRNMQQTAMQTFHRKHGLRSA